MIVPNGSLTTKDLIESDDQEVTKVDHTSYDDGDVDDAIKWCVSSTDQKDFVDIRTLQYSSGGKMFE